MLTNFRAGNFPAAYSTITSVPPAIGSHAPGSSANSETTACKRAGRNELVVPRIGPHVVVRRRAASATASKICIYPVQRHRLPESPSRMSSIVGAGFFCNSCKAARIIPGVQIPHCAPPHSRNACCRRATAHRRALQS